MADTETVRWTILKRRIDPKETNLLGWIQIQEVVSGGFVAGIVTYMGTQPLGSSQDSKVFTTRDECANDILEVGWNHSGMFVNLNDDGEPDLHELRPVEDKVSLYELIELLGRNRLLAGTWLGGNNEVDSYEAENKAQALIEKHFPGAVDGDVHFERYDAEDEAT